MDIKLKTFASCGKCALYRDGQCLIQSKPKDEKDFCNEFRNHIDGCSICGRGILKNAIISDNLILCSGCYNQMGTCVFCKKSAVCAFQQYAGPLQKIVLIQQRQGNMMMQTQGKNPDVVRETCGNCDCYDGQNCLREIVKTCGKYDEIS